MAGSLTAELAERGSPAREWMETQFPFADADVVGWPRGGCVVGPPAVSSHLRGRVGCAFDYRVRLAFGPLQPEELMAQVGWQRVVLLQAHWGDPMRGGKRAVRHARQWAAERLAAGTDPVSRVCGELAPAAGLSGGAPAAEERVASGCLLLAAYEELARAPLAVVLGESPHPAWAAGADPHVSGLRNAVAETELVADLVALWVANRALVGRIAAAGSVVRNPVFGDEQTVGADGDLLVDDVLLELKTAARTKFRREEVYQLLGYWLLSAGRHGIDRLGVWRARSARCHVWPAAELAAVCANRPRVDASALAAGFAAAVAVPYSLLRGAFRGPNGRVARARTRQLRAAAGSAADGRCTPAGWPPPAR